MDSETFVVQWMPHSSVDMAFRVSTVDEMLQANRESISECGSPILVPLAFAATRSDAEESVSRFSKVLEEAYADEEKRSVDPIYDEINDEIIAKMKSTISILDRPLNDADHVTIIVTDGTECFVYSSMPYNRISKMALDASQVALMSGAFELIKPWNESEEPNAT